MSRYERFVHWLDGHRDAAFDLLRVYLGIGLFVRGVLFFYDPGSYLALVAPASGAWLTSPVLLYLIASIHLVGGLMLAVGFLTRIAALVQIPILAGAVFLVHFQGGLLTPSQSFEFSALVLFLLVLIFIYDSGRWSVDHYLQRRYRLFPQLDAWTERHHDFAFDLLRAYLGIGLFVRGVLFIEDASRFMELLGSSPGALFTSVALIHYIAFAHLVGGLMLAVGFLTRIAALVQIPILAGAVFLVHFQGGLIAPSQSFEFSVLVLFLLVLFALYGSGRWSADYHLFVRRTQEPEAAYLVAPSPGAQAILRRQALRTRPPQVPVQQRQEHLAAGAARSRRQQAARRPWTVGELAGVSALGATGLLLFLYLFVPFTLSAAELLVIFLGIVFVSFTFASFYKKWAHSYNLMDQTSDEPAEREEHTGAAYGRYPREKAGA